MFIKRQSGLLLLVILVAVVAVLGVLYLLMFEPPISPDSEGSKVTGISKKIISKMAENKSWMMDSSLDSSPLPEDIGNHIAKVSISESTVQAGNSKEVYCQEAKPLLMPDGPYAKQASNKSILLLHGMKFKSQTWVDKPMETIQTMSLLGHHVLACDLPGFGKSPKQQNEIDRIGLIEDLLKHFQLERPVLVSPSMSGSYALPFLVKKSEMLLGYVPVAPVMTDAHKSLFPNINTPTLILYGDQDTSLGQESYNNLKLLPNSKAIVLEKARHPAYLDQPDRFHKLLNNFINILN